MKLTPNNKKPEHDYIDEKPDIKEDETIGGRKTTINYHPIPKQPLQEIAGGYRSPLFIDYVNRPDYWDSWTDIEGE